MSEISGLHIFSFGVRKRVIPLPVARSLKAQMFSLGRKVAGGACLHSLEETLSCLETQTGSSTLTWLIFPSVYIESTAYLAPLISNRKKSALWALPKGQHLFDHHLLLARAL